MATVQLTADKFNPANLKRVARAKFDHADFGNLAAADIVKSGVFIPEGALITRAWYYVETTFSGGGGDAATIKLGLTSDDDEFVAALAISDGTNIWDAGFHGTLVGFGGVESGDNAETAIENAASDSATFYHVTQDGGDEIMITIGTNTVTAGKMYVFVEYYMTDDLA
mgnify:CR=1 FL=1